MATSEPRQTKKNQPVRLVFLQIDDLPEFIWSGRRESNTTPNPLFETRFFLFAQWEKTILCTAHLPLASKVVYQGLLTSTHSHPRCATVPEGTEPWPLRLGRPPAEIPGKVIDHLCGRVPYRNRFCPSTPGTMSTGWSCRGTYCQRSFKVLLDQRSVVRSHAVSPKNGLKNGCCLPVWVSISPTLHPYSGTCCKHRDPRSACVYFSLIAFPAGLSMHTDQSNVPEHATWSRSANSWCVRR